MTFGSHSFAEQPFASTGDGGVAGGVGSLSPFTGFGVQGTSDFRGERFWADEQQTRFIARETDGEEMLGVTDKDPVERVWYECDFIDLLHGASILALSMGTFGSITVLNQQLVSNGETTHLARVLVSGGGAGEVTELRFNAQCSDGAYRKRTLKIRIRTL